jgi:hypothetical protein
MKSHAALSHSVYSQTARFQPCWRPQRRVSIGAVSESKLRTGRHSERAMLVACDSNTWSPERWNANVRLLWRRRIRLLRGFLEVL